MLIVLEGWLIAILFVYAKNVIQGKKKIKIMSVRSELRKVRRMDEADRKNMF